LLNGIAGLIILHGLGMRNRLRMRISGRIDHRRADHVAVLLDPGILIVFSRRWVHPVLRSGTRSHLRRLMLRILFCRWIDHIPLWRSYRLRLKRLHHHLLSGYAIGCLGSVYRDRISLPHG
jgi:hypothetical protein